MHTTPILQGRPVNRTTCGRLANQNRERSFWQSRMTVAGGRAEPVDLVDLRALARDVRRGPQQ